MKRPDPEDGDASLWKGEDWLTLGGFQDVKQGYAEGWCDGRRDGVLPIPGLRIIRVTVPGYAFDKVVHEYPEDKEVRAGMMPCGYGFQWPYILGAADRALKRAEADALQAAEGGHAAIGIATLRVHLQLLLGR